jgi:hypothetical protein
MRSELPARGHALRDDDMFRMRTVGEPSSQLCAMLRARRVLLLIDAAWDPPGAFPFMVGGKNYATLVSTRVDQLAKDLAAIERQP